MTEPTYPAWIEAAPEPKRTIYKISYDEVKVFMCMEVSRSQIPHSGLPISAAEKSYWVDQARAANHRVLALRRQLRAMKEATDDTER